MNHRRNITSGFSLIEILTVLAVLSLLLAILTPALSKAKRAAKALLSSKNQKEIVAGVSCYAVDNNDAFPRSIATIGKGDKWSWREPTILTGFQKLNPQSYRSIAEYMNNYINFSATMFCPAAPSRYTYAQDAWEAGDLWDNPEPDTGSLDPLYGNYCFLWNYIGYLENKDYPFIGPQKTAGRKYESKLLVCDYFGYGHWRNELTYGSHEAFGSCDKFNTTGITQGTSVSCDFWSKFNGLGHVSLDSITIKLRAGFMDGHVEEYSAEDVINMRVSLKQDGSIPYPDDTAQGGIYYLPRNSW